jgi:lysophospholipase L1-like esterase
MRGFRRVGYAVYLTASVCLLLLLAEVGVRWVVPQANQADTERVLFDVAGDLVRWRPRATGMSFGRPVAIDEFGFRDLGAGSATATESWLVLGDSVTFGVGVDARETFAGRLQAAHASIKIWNTAVVGYSLEDYWAVLQEFLATHPPPTRVLLFLCLNDPMDRQRLNPETESLPQRTLGFLRRNSRLYIVAKGVFTDRSQSYWRHDLAYYDSANSHFKRALDHLDRIRARLVEAGIPLLVVVLPYEYQLRDPTVGNRLPQRMLAEQFARMHIAFIDLYDAFAAHAGPVADLFLYRDPMHLSAAGHALVYDEVTRSLTSP